MRKYWRRATAALDTADEALLRSAQQGVGEFFRQGGNSYGATAELGTNDDEALQLFAHANAANNQITLGNSTHGISIGNAPVPGVGAVTISGSAVVALSSSGGDVKATAPAGSGLVLTAGVSPSSGAGTVTIDALDTVLVGAQDATQITVGGSSLGNANIDITGGGTTPGQGITIGTHGANTDTNISAVRNVTITAGAAAQLEGTTTLALAANGGAVSLDATANVNIGASNATGLVLGNGPNTASITIAGTAALTSNSASATGGVAIPATCEEFIVVTFRGNIRKIAAFAA